MNLAQIKQEGREEFSRNLLDRPAGSVADYEDYCRDVSTFLDTLIDKVVDAVEEHLGLEHRIAEEVGRAEKGNCTFANSALQDVKESLRNFRGL